MACCKLATVDSGKVAKGDCCDMAKGDCCNTLTGKAPGFWDTKTNCCPGKDVVRKVGGVPGVRGKQFAGTASGWPKVGPGVPGVRGKQFANPAAGTASGWPKVGPGVPGVRGKQFAANPAGTASGWPKVGPGVRGAAARTVLEARPGVAGAADDTRLSLFVVNSFGERMSAKGTKFHKTCSR
jgi:hypothetical protein